MLQIKLLASKNPRARTENMEDTAGIDELEAQLLAHYADVPLSRYDSYRGLEDAGLCIVQNGERIGGVSAGKRELKILYDLVRIVGAKQTLQIGVAFGLSTHALASASAENQITAMDNFSEHPGEGGIVKDIARRTLSNYPNVNLRVATSPVDTAQCLNHLAPDEKLCLAFIDGMHTNEAAAADYKGLRYFLNSRSVVLWHDIDQVNEAFHNCFDTTLFDLRIRLRTWGNMGVYINSSEQPAATAYLKSSPLIDEA